MDDRIKEVYSLRKERKLNDALKLALNVHKESPDDDINKALSWVAIDLCKNHIACNDLVKAQNCFNMLSKIRFSYPDDFVETIQKQIRFLKPKIDIHYSQLHQAIGPMLAAMHGQRTAKCEN